MDEFSSSSAARRRAQMEQQRKAVAKREADLKAVLGIGVLILVFLWSIAYMIWHTAEPPESNPQECLDEGVEST